MSDSRKTVWSHDFDGQSQRQHEVWEDLHKMFAGTNVSVMKDDQLVIVQTWTLDDMSEKTIRELVRQRVRYHA